VFKLSFVLMILMELLTITDNSERVEKEVFAAMQIREFQDFLDLLLLFSPKTCVCLLNYV
jgi:hypothetical protein